MLQDIAPHKFDGTYAQRAVRAEDYVLAAKGRQLLLRYPPDALRSGLSPFPTCAELRAHGNFREDACFYLFSLDGQGFFCTEESLPASETFRYQDVMLLRELEHDAFSFAGAVGHQLCTWYAEHRFCGACGTRTVHSDAERALVCPSCGTTLYPGIAPVVIIAILDGERILLTRYSRNGYRRHALVAGFVEVGETLEAAVRREIMEEVGLQVTNIRYCESQPWPFSASLIAGFFADVDGDPTVHLNTDGGEELAEAVWVDRKNLVLEDNSVSLTWDMIRKFRDGKEPKKEETNGQQSSQ